MTVLDQEGIELAGTVDAEVEAAERAQHMVNRGSLNGASMNGEFLSAHGRIIVADDNWQTLFEFPF
jgi:hypothetical protein